jgi:hypothetical protein
LGDRGFAEQLDRLLAGEPELRSRAASLEEQIQRERNAISSDHENWEAHYESSQRLQDELRQIQDDLEVTGMGARREAAERLMRRLRARLLGRETPETRAMAERYVVTDEAADSIARARGISEPDPDLRRAAARRALQDDIEEWIRLVGPEHALDPSYRFVLDPASPYHPRAYHRPGARPHINVGEGITKSAAFHELGHYFDTSRPLASQQAMTFVEARARYANQGRLPAPRPLNELNPPASGESPRYRPSEVAYDADLISHYAAKVYPSGDPGTEVLSTGIEHFSSPRSMLDLYAADPEHFFFIMGVLR